MNKVRLLLRLSNPQRGILLRAALWVAGFKLGLRLLPFRRTCTLITILARPARGRSARRELAPEQVRWAVAAAGRLWGANCLPRALAAYVLLHRSGQNASLEIGAALDDAGQLSAHAWVKLDCRVIVGDLPDLDRYTRLPLVWNPGDRFRLAE